MAKSPEKVYYDRIQAQVKFYNREKGFGFCKRANKQDVFFSAKELERCGISHVKENDLLEFDLVPVEGKGGRAVKIKVIK